MRYFTVKIFAAYVLLNVAASTLAGLDHVDGGWGSALSGIYHGVALALLLEMLATEVKRQHNL